MTSLVLRLAGPLQSWGTEASFATRTTSAVPTKTGVIGLLAAALGRPRGSDLSDLESMPMTVRVNRAGTRQVDFQTARSIVNQKPPNLIHREYLMDADFLVVLEPSDAEAAEEYAEALLNPVYALYLGRRSCPPSHPILVGLDARPPSEVVRDPEAGQQLDGRPLRESKRPYRIVRDARDDDPDSSVYRVLESYVSTDPLRRRFGPRFVVDEFWLHQAKPKQADPEEIDELAITEEKACI